MRIFPFIQCVIIASSGCFVGSTLATDPESALISLDEYFKAETERIQNESLQDISSLEDWENKRQEFRNQLRDMLGISSMPPKSRLQHKVVGSFESNGIIVERIHFQSVPGLYVTANLYRPVEQKEPLPTILYVCGHGRVKEHGISYGNKVHYHHHGCWFARNGYVCLTIDTLQLGEIEGIHHGTYRYDRWWWLNKGYTPAGVEAWNCIRALDYLETRSEVDSNRFGVTGRSGGGAYSWWIAALDDRIKCAVPVAGITDLQNHVVDGCVEGHCDCMYMVNTYQWDYEKVAALVAPRPLLISNTDNDRIFPLDGVIRLHNKVRQIYDYYGASEKLGLNITAGGHKDTQELRVHAFQWFNLHLKGETELIRDVAEKELAPSQLKVFQQNPRDELNTRIDEVFVADANKGETNLKASPTNFDDLLAELKEKTFAGWPSEDADLQLAKKFQASHAGIQCSRWEFQSQQHVALDLFLMRREGASPPDLVVLNVLDTAGWKDFESNLGGLFAETSASTSQKTSNSSGLDATSKMLKQFNWAMAYVAPRGIGPTAWPVSDKKLIQIRRRFYLLGQSLDGMQVFDIRRAIQATKELPALGESQFWLQSSGEMAAQSVYASLFEDEIYRLDLHQPVESHQEGPYLLNIDRICSVPQVVELASLRSKIVVYTEDNSGVWQNVLDRLAETPEASFKIRQAMSTNK